MCAALSAGTIWTPGFKKPYILHQMELIELKVTGWSIDQLFALQVPATSGCAFRLIRYPHQHKQLQGTHRNTTNALGKAFLNIDYFVDLYRQLFFHLNWSLRGSVNQPVSTSLILHLIFVKSAWTCPGLTNSMELSRSREANSYSATQGVYSSILLNRRIITVFTRAIH
jgi:hypothetical protein